MADFGDRADQLYTRQLDILQAMRRYAADVSATVNQLASELADLPPAAAPVQPLIDRLTARCDVLRAHEKSLADRVHLLNLAADAFRSDKEVAKAQFLVDSLESELARQDAADPDRPR